jgi:collagen beta-1,O-galactosyltransferase
VAVNASDLRVYVVNLRRRADRRARMTRVLPPELAAVFTSDWDGPFDGRELSLEALSGAGYELFPWPIASDNPWYARVLTRGEIGCALSHLWCWRDAAGRSEPYTVVFEDDIEFAPDFTSRLLAALGGLRDGQADLIYLGRCRRDPDEPPSPDRGQPAGLVVPGFSYSAIGYLVTRAGLAALLAAGLARALLPVDEFLPTLYTSHPRADVRARFPRRVPALAFEPPLVWDVPGAEADSDTRRSGAVLAAGRGGEAERADGDGAGAEVRIAVVRDQGAGDEQGAVGQ